MLWAATAWAEEAPLVDLALEDLGRLEVATVSRKAQKLSETSAAVTVLTAEDIRRSGARSVPEALREVPGVSVAQIGAGRWAIGVRGFAGRFSNKLLVLIDGRNVYSPIFSGVFWEALDVMLEDVERIEVVRGPGASLWGANAVNGVINIVTLKATASRGGLLSMQLDSQGHPAVAVRQGVELGGAGALRVFAKGNELAESRSAGGEPGIDGNRGWLAGFRVDSAGSGTNAWMVQGNIYRRSNRENLQARAQAGLPLLLHLGAELEGSSLVGRHTWGLAGGEASLQGYVDTQRIEAINYGTGEVRTADLDFQHRLAPMGAHELMWGLGNRFVETSIHLSTPVLVVSPSDRKFNVASAFVQDEITLQPRVWKLTLGGRFEHSTMSSLEPQPNARLMWTPTDADSVWANWSRAARTPSVGEIDTQTFAGLQQTGNPRMPVVAMVTRPGPNWEPRAERLDALELGYRRGFGNGSVEAVLFHHDYTHLTSIALDPGGVVLPGVAGLVPVGVLPLQYLNRGNVGSARSTGLELGLDLPVTESLRLQASYTLMDIRAGRSSDPVTQASGAALEEASPHYWANLHGLLSLGRGRKLDLMVRRVGAIDLGHVPAYTSVDLRYGWRVSRSFELAVVGLNLFDPLHQEHASDFVPSQPAYQPRQGFAQGLWRF